MSDVDRSRIRWAGGTRSPDEVGMRRLAFLGVRAPGGVGTGLPAGRAEGEAREFLAHPAW
ncbi:hypothetical protein GCM10010360_26450 [Streptomyces nogalater]